MNLSKNIKDKVLVALLAVTALATGHTTAWAASTFTVKNPTGSTFRITRTGNTKVAETVNYRTVSLSAIEGQHFTAASGTVNFGVDISYVDITITESSPGENAYKFQASSQRTYRFEVLDRDGYTLASCDRSRDYGTQFTDTYLNKSITGLTYFDKNSGNFLSGTTHYLDVAHSGSAGKWVKVNDGGYKQAVHTVTTGTLYNNNNNLRNYLNSNSVKMYATVYFTQKEENDGYQYIQILADNVSTYDGNDSNGAVNTPSTSIYKACFILSYDPSGSVETNPHTQFFPHRWDYADRKAQYSGNSWNWQEFDYDNAHLYQQAFKNDSYRAENSGSLVLAPTVNSLNIRFDAAGSNEDDWYFKDLKVRLALVDATAPTVLDNYKVSGGRHQKGNTIYVSVPFSEIVTVTGTPTLSTTWGTLNYVAGSGSNVLTFSGTISNDATSTLSVTAHSGSISDLAGNNFSGSISKDFDTTLDTNYAWSLSDFRQLETNTYEIATKQDLRHLALMVNGNYNNCSGLTFRQTQNITCDNTYIPIGVYYSGNKPFRGTYDGQGHTVSGITVTRTGYDYADSYMGIFGYVLGATVQNVILASSTFTGYQYIGGIVGYNSNGTIQNCRVESTVTIKAGNDYADHLGGIVGYSSSPNAKVIGCVSAATVSPNGKSYCQHYGGIVGYQGNSTVKNCLYTGTSVDAANYKGAIVGSKSGGTLTNNYYTSISLGGVGSGNSNDDQNGARRARTVTLGTGVTLSGAQTTYNVSGLTAIGTTALQSGSTIYSGEGQTLTLSYSGDVPTGYSFKGFSVNGSPIDGNSFEMPASDVTVTPIMTPNTYSVHFDANGGTGNMDDQEFTYGVSQQLAANAYTREGYVFAGWATKSNGDVVYTDQQSVSNLATEQGAIVELFAKWTAEQSEVTYIDEFGKEQICEQFTLIESGDELMFDENADHWFVVKGDVTIDGPLVFETDIFEEMYGLLFQTSPYTNEERLAILNGRRRNIILCDGATLTAKVTFALNLNIYGQKEGTGRFISSSEEIDMGFFCPVLNVNGGHLSAHSPGVGIFAGNIGINGGSVVADGDIIGIATLQFSTEDVDGTEKYVGGDIILGWRSASDCLVASNYQVEGFFAIKGGQTFTDGEGNLYSGELTDEEIEALAGKTLIGTHPLNDTAEAPFTALIGQGATNVTLANRTIDTEWNTLAVPFDVSAEQLEETFGADVKLYELSSSTYDAVNEELGLAFASATEMNAGQPYFIKVSANVQNPTFRGVTVLADENPTPTNYVDFVPTLGATTIGNEGQSVYSVIFLGGGNKLYNPPYLPVRMKGFRGYFDVHDWNGDPLEAAQFRMAFDEESVETGILRVDSDRKDNGLIYNLMGQRVRNSNGKGLYIKERKKIVVRE